MELFDPLVPTHERSAKTRTLTPCGVDNFTEGWLGTVVGCGGRKQIPKVVVIVCIRCAADVTDHCCLVLTGLADMLCKGESVLTADSEVSFPG